MFHIIENLQRKPEHVRKRIAFLTAGFVVFIIILIWITISSGIFSTSQSVSQEIVLSPASLPEQGKIAPLTLLKEQFKQLYSLFLQ